MFWLKLHQANSTAPLQGRAFTCPGIKSFFENFTSYWLFQIKASTGGAFILKVTVIPACFPSCLVAVCFFPTWPHLLVHYAGRWHSWCAHNTCKADTFFIIIIFVKYVKLHCVLKIATPTAPSEGEAVVWNTWIQWMIQIPGFIDGLLNLINHLILHICRWSADVLSFVSALNSVCIGLC